MASEESTPSPITAALRGRRGGVVTRGNSARLPSIRTPRDLTLGGSQKKTFVPNIPQRRDKQKEESGEHKDDKKKRKGRGERKPRGGARGRGRGQAEFIQSHSIFEDGLSDRLKAKRGGVEMSSAGGSGSGAGPSRGVIKKEAEKLSDKMANDLFRDDFVSDLRGTIDVNLEPITLPLTVKREVKLEEKDEKLDVKVKQEGGEKMEEVEKMEVEEEVDGSEQTGASTAQGHRAEITPAELFSRPAKSEYGEILFVQLPDVLPGDKPQTEEQSEKKTESNSQCSLRDFKEGHIGKLRVHKSGRTSLLLGNTALDISMGTPAGFLQELSCIQINDDRSSADMTLLSQIKHKLFCIPDFDSMLDQVTSSR